MAHGSVTGRRNNEIVELEVTPEMIKAGADKLLWFNINEDDHLRIIREMLVAMAEESFLTGNRLHQKSTDMEGAVIYRLHVPTLEELFPGR